MSLFHFHKWSDIKEGYQHCLVCNKIRTVECFHTYEVYKSFTISNTFNNNVHTTQYLNRCSKCGDMKNHRIGVID